MTAEQLEVVVDEAELWRVLIRHGLEPVVLTLCTYEVAAILSRRRLPTLSKLTERYPWLAPTLIGGLSAHLYPKFFSALRVQRVRHG